MTFLQAEWRKLVIANYVVDSSFMKKYVPYKTELDLWQGKCYVSLVGFMFLNTKILGLKIPFHTNFEEVNLRLYVRYKVNGEWRRGVVFIKEIVPKMAVTLIANHLYKENYQTLPMHHNWYLGGTSQRISYQWKHRGVWHHMAAESEPNAIEIPPGSEEEFITEHYWGYTKVTNFKTREYEVTHPKWKVYPVKHYDISVQFEKLYGEQFADLTHAIPESVMLAEGSPVAIEYDKSL